MAQTPPGRRIRKRPPEPSDTRTGGQQAAELSRSPKGDLPSETDPRSSVYAAGHAEGRAEGRAAGRLASFKPRSSPGRGHRIHHDSPGRPTPRPGGRGVGIYS